MLSVPFPPVTKPRFTFIDLFARIGGFRLALQKLGGKALFSSEWDPQAQRTYFLNFGKFNANGGYIVVKEDGDIICYHFFDRNELEDYLFYNTRFETPSTSRHGFGKIYEEGEDF